MQIVIPTRGRTNQQLTLQSLPRELRQRTTLVCPKQEAVRLEHLYADVEIVVQPDPDWTIARKREWIMREWMRAGYDKIIFLDDETAEAGYQLTDPGQTAEQIFHARWVAALIEGALSRLQAEMEQSGKKKLFDQICGFLLEDEESSYIEVSQRTGLTISAVKAAIYRLRGRYRELLRAEVARTVMSSADFDDEIRSFRASLAGRQK